MNCFNCGSPLKAGSIKCPVCGFLPDVEFMRKCPNLQVAKCCITGNFCKFLGEYQTCPIKNDVESKCNY